MKKFWHGLEVEVLKEIIPFPEKGITHDLKRYCIKLPDAFGDTRVVWGDHLFDTKIEMLEADLDNALAALKNGRQSVQIKEETVVEIEKRIRDEKVAH